VIARELAVDDEVIATAESRTEVLIEAHAFDGVAAVLAEIESCRGPTARGHSSRKPAPIGVPLNTQPRLSGRSPCRTRPPRDVLIGLESRDRRAIGAVRPFATNPTIVASSAIQ